MFDCSGITDFEPCPLCGDMPIVKIELRSGYEHFAVTCDCGVAFTGSDVFSIDLWNIRPERTCVDLAAQDDKFRCSFCNYECKCAKGSSFDYDGLPRLAYCPECGAKVVS